MITKLVANGLVWFFLFVSSVSVAEQVQSKATSIIESYGIALHGNLAYAEDFEHFSWVKPDAPKGGKLRLMGFGTFDSLNPYTLKGISPFNSPGQFMYGFSELNETLLVGTGNYSPSGDEAQSAYGLIAKKIRYPTDYAWVEFDLNPKAAFHDGHRIDAQDVLFSYKTLIDKGHPRFQQSFLGIDNVEVITPSRVRFNFKPPYQKANIIRAGELPVLPQHYWQDKDFEKASEIPPLLSGPYKIKHVELGSHLLLQRNNNFWAKELNVYKGRFNFDEVSIHYFRDQTIAFEAFKSDEFDIFYDYTAKNWASAYNFPALAAGNVIKREIRHEIPSGTQGFFFNTRRKLFADSRVREAISLMFDFEWTNKALFNDAYQRNKSYYPNSKFSATDTPQGEELKLLTPFKEQLPSALFDQSFDIPTYEGDGNIRPGMRKALALLKSADWAMHNKTLRHRQTQQTFEFEIIYRQAGLKRIILPFVKNLARIGINATPRLLETTQYKVRLDQFDFDMSTFVLSQGLSPSYEQRDYFHSSLADVEGSQNYSGIKSTVVDAMVSHVLEAKDERALQVAMKALDRVLLWKHYIIPNWHLNYHRVAYWNRFGIPTEQPTLKLGVENWWASH